tara:strand:- start:749 stop:943 length:195 start_codon:yes stop_codon:yes gene_type:complete
MPDRIAIGLDVIPNKHRTDFHHREAGNASRMRKAEATDRMKQRRKKTEDNSKRLGSGNHPIAHG